jgi:xanthine dehydrogenase accessory factor
MIDVLREAARAGAEGAAVALATVIRTGGSTPRHPGAKMIVAADGAITGTIGGGKIELEVAEVGASVAAGEGARRVTKHLGHDLAMCCGGSMDVWVEPLDAPRWKALAEAARRREARATCVLVTALDVVGGGGKDVLGDHPCLAARRPVVDGDRLYEPVFPTPRLVLFGAGHVARAIAPLAATVGFELVVCDEDERFAAAERFPGARLVHTFDPRDLPAELGAFGAGDHVIILTRDHALDQAILEQLLARRDLPYLGLIGSRGKLGRFRKRLEAKGIGGEADWARLRSPVGLDIGAETPEEIAVAVVAELVRARNVPGGDMSGGDAPADHR